MFDEINKMPSEVSMRSLMISLTGAVLLCSCAWVELTADGEKVRVANATEVTQCQRLGQTTASVADSVGALKRRDDIVKVNLEKLARNSAADMRGDAVVAVSEIANGKQTFDVYRCR